MDFDSCYAHGFARVAACTIPVAIADPATNAASVQTTSIVRLTTVAISRPANRVIGRKTSSASSPPSRSPTRASRLVQELVDLATARGFGPGTKAGPILAWLQEDFGLGRGHGMALVHVITKGPAIDAKHVGTTGSHRDDSTTLRLDGAAHRTSDA